MREPSSRFVVLSPLPPAPSPTPAGLFFEILLVVVLGQVELRGGGDFGDDGAGEAAGFLERRLGRAGRLFLFVVVDEDRAACSSSPPD